ncbi:MAG: hypothetical protein DLM71_09570 [Chloroflexi bacterium]|nr:MAG: hypothetical protein DLM71_09570 [Chloroflexota bacterium]
MTERQSAVVELHDVWRRYGTGDAAIVAIRGLSVCVGAGERLAITGPSGAGKTTLLGLMGLLDMPDEGRVVVAGQTVDGTDEDERAELRRAHVGFIFQMFHLIPALSALDNVTVPLLPYRRRVEIEDRAQQLLARLGLANRLSHRPSQLSAGEQQRVAIARALINQPGLVIGDEPTGNLDSVSGDRVVGLLEELRQEAHFALVVATHDERVASTFERRLRLRDGREDLAHG